MAISWLRVLEKKRKNIGSELIVCQRQISDSIHVNYRIMYLYRLSTG